VGMGAIPWAELFNACVFPQDSIFNIELAKRYWHWRQDCVDAMVALQPEIKTRG
jgi:hypothetical protein